MPYVVDLASVGRTNAAARHGVAAAALVREPGGPARPAGSPPRWPVSTVRQPDRPGRVGSPNRGRARRASRARPAFPLAPCSDGQPCRWHPSVGARTGRSGVSSRDRSRRRGTRCTPGLVRHRRTPDGRKPGRHASARDRRAAGTGVRHGRQSLSRSSGRDLSRCLPRLVPGSGWAGRQTRAHPDPLFNSLVVSLLLLSTHQLLHRRKLAFQCFVVHPESSRGRE